MILSRHLERGQDWAEQQVIMDNLVHCLDPGIVYSYHYITQMATGEVLFLPLIPSPNPGVLWV